MGQVYRWLISMRGLEYLHSLGAEWKSIGEIGLDSTLRLLAWFGNPHDSLQVVHVAGTNGKGSVSAAISSIIACSGASVGTYTSPHLQDIAERVLINGKPVSLEVLDDALFRVFQAATSIGLKPTFYEAITVAGFLIFADFKVDWVVSEVGLGGRLDATNVISNPAACVITTIDFDHQQQLGNTLAAIAREKAGIIKENSIVLLGKMSLEAKESILSVASGLSAKTYEIDKDFEAQVHSYREFTYRSGIEQIDYSSGLLGAHQADNLAIAIHTCRCLGFSPSDCISGVSRVFWPGRLERIEWKGRDVLLDCAHNPAGVGTLVSYLKSREVSVAMCLFGVLASKEWKEMLNQLTEVARSWVLLEPANHRALPNQEVQGHLSCAGIRDVVLVDQTIAALNALEQRSVPGDLIVVCGSMYMLGDIRPALGARPICLW